MSDCQKELGEEMNEALRAVSNVIELKPDRKYLLVVSGDNINPRAAQEIGEMLQEYGICGVIIHLTTEQSLQVIEAPQSEGNDRD